MTGIAGVLQAKRGAGELEPYGTLGFGSYTPAQAEDGEGQHWLHGQC